MKKPNEYALMGAQARQLAIEAKPEEGNPCKAALGLAEWHLKQAAQALLSVAEYRVGKAQEEESDAG